MAGPDGVIRWGMIGCGDVTERKSGPAYARVPGSCLAGVTSRSLNKARDYASRYGVGRVFEDAASLIGDPDIDAIYIATPPSSHLVYALMAARAGKPCCVEKPMALDVEQSRVMLEAFKTAGQPLFVAYYRRSLPRFAAVRDWLKTGAIGEPRHIHWSLTRPADPQSVRDNRPWRVDPVEAPGGYFDDLAGHGLDLFDQLLGPIEAVTGSTAQQAGLYDVPDAVAASWRHAGGVTGTAHWNFAAFDRVDRVEITGAEGRIRFAVFDEAPLCLETAAGRVEQEIANPDPIQWHHVEAMIRHLAGGPAHPSLGCDALRTAQVCERILQGDTGRISS